MLYDRSRSSCYFERGGPGRLGKATTQPLGCSDGENACRRMFLYSMKHGRSAMLPRGGS